MSTSPLPDGRAIARRALALFAVADSATVHHEIAEAEQYGDAVPRKQAATVQREQKAFLEDLDLRTALEPHERKAIDLAPGKLAEEDALALSHGFEAAAVCLWALGLHPPLRELDQVDPRRVGRTLGYMNAKKAAALVAKATRVISPKDLKRELERVKAQHEDEANQTFEVEIRMLHARHQALRWLSGLAKTYAKAATGVASLAEAMGTSDDPDLEAALMGMDAKVQLTRKLLDATEDDLLLHQLNRFADQNRKLARSSPVLKALEGFGGVHAEIENGGLSQLFWNSTREEIPEAIRSFRAIGAKEHAAFLQNAVRVFEENDAGLLEKARRKRSGDGYVDFDKKARVSALTDSYFDLKPKLIAALRAKSSHLVALGKRAS